MKDYCNHLVYESNHNFLQTQLGHILHNSQWLAICN
jgi:hypothetical protein